MKHHSKRTQHARGQEVMEGGDNVGGANNDVGEGASSGAAVPAGGGGIVDSSSLVVEVGNGFTAIYNIIDAGSL